MIFPIDIQTKNTHTHAHTNITMPPKKKSRKVEEITEKSREVEAITVKRQLLVKILTTDDLFTMIGIFADFKEFVGKDFIFRRRVDNTPAASFVKGEDKIVLDKMQLWISLLQVNKDLQKMVKKHYMQWVKQMRDHFTEESTGGVFHPLETIIMSMYHGDIFRKYVGSKKISMIQWETPHYNFRWETEKEWEGLDLNQSKINIITYLINVMDFKCSICKKKVSAKFLWGTWKKRVCKECKRICSLEISTITTRYGIKDMMNSLMFKEGIIQICRDDLTNSAVKHIDPFASMLINYRPIFLVRMDSLILGVGTEKFDAMNDLERQEVMNGRKIAKKELVFEIGTKALKEMKERKEAMDKFARTIVNNAKSYLVRELYLQLLNEGRMKSIGKVINLHKKLFRDTKKKNEYLQNIYEHNGRTYVPGMNQIPPLVTILHPDTKDILNPKREDIMELV